MLTTRLLTLLFLVSCGSKPLPGGGVGDDDDDDIVGDDDDDAVGDDDDDDDDECGGCEGDETCIDGACVDCDPTATWPHTADPSVVHLVVRNGHDADEERLLARPVELSAPARVAVGPGIDLFTDVMSPVDDGDTLDAGRYLVLARAPGSSTLRFTPPAACPDAAPTEHILQAHPDRPILGRELAMPPYLERVDLFGPGDAVALGIDTVEHADRLGITADLVFVEDRSAAEWVADPGFGTVVHQASIEVGTPEEAWASLPSGAGLVGRYDAVLDLDGDGTLSPGDLVQGFDGPAFGVAGDLSAPGPHEVSEFDWSASFWITQKTYHPTDMSSLDPLPLVVISHGNGHDYLWYDYLGRHLASWGYVVTSHRNNTEPGPVSASVTTLDNTDTLLGNLGLIGGGVLDGEIDPTQIVWIGHSRGGEGVVLAYESLVNGSANPSSYGPEDIQLISSIAPTIFQGPQQADPNDAPYHLLAGSSDGDVTGAPDCGLCQYFRLFKNGTAPSWVSYFQGSTHNDFHDDVPGSFDDGIFVNGTKIGSQRTQAGTRAYYLALLEHVVRGDELLDAYLERAPESFRPSSVDFVVSTQAWRATTRSVIDDFQSNPALTVSSSGGAVSGDVDNLEEGLADDGNTNLSANANDPMNGMTWADGDGADAARVAVFDWQADRQLDFELTGALTDASTATHLSVRVAQATRHALTVQNDGMSSFTIALVDGAGTEVGFDTRAWGGVPKPAHRTGAGSGAGWVNEFQTIRVPLDAFTAEGSGLDLSDLTTVRLRFGPSHGAAVGRVGIDDLAFLTEETP